MKIIRVAFVRTRVLNTSIEAFGASARAHARALPENSGYVILMHTENGISLDHVRAIIVAGAMRMYTYARLQIASAFH